MMDVMMPLPRTEADARYDLSRLSELLPLVGQHLECLGVSAFDADHLKMRAAQLRHDIAAIRDATLRQQAARVPA